ncbi:MULTISPECIES: hypothetical protein [Actinomycetes]|uniref:Uncharacterized protein n=2 Tax=Actinomycetes TaxID=1760 RepID=A0ABP6LTM6_9MICC
MAAAKRRQPVPRPLKKAEYEIRFATVGAQKGWQDLLGTIRNQMVEAWDFLTRTPGDPTRVNYRLKGDLAVKSRVVV